MPHEDAEAVRRMAKSVAAQLGRQHGGLSASAMDTLVADGMYGAALAWESWKPDGGASFTSWAFPYIKRYATIALYESQGRNGRGQHRGEQSLDAMLAAEDPFDVEDPHTDRAFTRAEVRSAVRGAIGDLPDRERTAVVGVYWDGLTREEVGSRLGVGKTMARRIIDRAHDRLRVTLAPLAPYAEAG